MQVTDANFHTPRSRILAAAATCHQIYIKSLLQTYICHFFQLNYTTTIFKLFSRFFFLLPPINSFFYEIGISLLNELTMLNGRQIRDLTSSRWCQHLIPSKARLLRLLGIILACHISAKKRLLFYVTTLRHKTEDVSADFQKMAKIAPTFFASTLTNGPYFCVKILQDPQGLSEFRILTTFLSSRSKLSAFYRNRSVRRFAHLQFCQ